MPKLGANRSGASAPCAETDVLFRTLAESNPDAIVVAGPEGVVSFINAAGLALMGFGAPEEVLGRPWAELWPEEHRDEVLRAQLEARSGHPWRYRAFLTRDDGLARWLDTVVSPVVRDGGVSALIAVSRDVTREIETQSFLDNIIEYVPAAIFAKDARDGRYVMVNLAAEDFLGHAREDLLGRTVEEIFPADRAKVMLDRQNEVISSGRILSFEQPVRQDGVLRYYQVRLMCTYGDEGPRHIIGVSEEITEQRRAAEALKTAAERAEAANRSKSEFLANMSHEIRTPLNGVVGVADVLARTDLTDPQRDMVEIIRSSGVTLDRLLSDVLDLARIESGRLEIESEPFHLADAARAITGLLSMRAQEKGVALNLVVAPEAEGRVVGDAVRLKQILTNLLSNAVKFTEKGEVRLTVSYLGGGDRRFRFDVSDTGVGFDAAQKKRVFARFQQADGSITRRFGGTGLGLAISRQLAELMGGSLDCESKPGKGSIFSVLLPMPEAEAESNPGEAGGAGVEFAAKHARDDRPMRVLLADDHPTNRKVVELILGQVGVELTSVEDGLAAVEAYAADDYDAILMDMQMPGMDGLTATRAIRHHEQVHGLTPTPIFMLTANALSEHLEASRHAGADRHLTKPITADKLLGALAEIEPAATADAPARGAKQA
jgi:PAS domain S-box-containing protein